MSEKKKKIPGTAPRFGILDVVIILLIIVAVVGVYFRYNILDWISSTQNISDYTVSYTVEDIRYTTPSYMKIDDEVYFASSGERFGVLTSADEKSPDALVPTLPASEYFTKVDGTIVKVMYPDIQNDTYHRTDAKGRLICQGRYSDESGFLVNGSTYIAPGQKIDIRTELVSITIRIEEITAVEAEQ